MIINVVPDQPCPGCGAYWGNPDKALDFPNRIKVDNDWKCYNPECEVAYYRDGKIMEYEPTPEQKAKMKAEIDAFIKDIKFEQIGENQWRVTGG